MEPVVHLRQRTELTLTPRQQTQMTRQQLALVFDDVLLQDITPAERQAVLRTLAQLLLEACGVASREVGDDQ
jgi:hypothetical protein